MRIWTVLLLFALLFSLGHSLFREMAFAHHLARTHASMELLAKPVAVMAKACPEARAEFEMILSALTKDPTDWPLIVRLRQKYQRLMSDNEEIEASVR